MAETPTKLFSVEVAITLPDNKREITFSLTKTEESPTKERWMIEFILKEKVKIDNKEQTINRVSVKVDLLDKKEVEGAAKIVQAGKLSQERTKLLLGKVQATAAAMPPNTTQASKTLKDLLKKVVS